MATNDDKTGTSKSGQDPRQEELPDEAFSLEMQQVPAQTIKPHKSPTGKSASFSRQTASPAAEVLSYRHGNKRTNNPHVGMVDTHSDGVEGKTVWQYDPHIDPAL